MHSFTRRAILTRPPVLPYYHRRVRFSTSIIRRADPLPTTPKSDPLPAPSSTAKLPPPPKKRGRFLKYTWRTLYISALGSVGLYAYFVYSNRHPAEQIQHDPSKKNLVILGSGWGSTSILKNIDAENYNISVVSPRNYFLFTPLLPSCTTGTVELRSIMEPIRYIIRHKKAAVAFYEAEASTIDHENKTVTITDTGAIKGDTTQTTIPFDYLVVGVGAENNTFGIPGVYEHACFLKETWDASKIRTRIMDCIEAATFKDQTEEERKRLLHMVVVGGGPTGIEFAAELHDFFSEDLKTWFPEIKDLFKITLVEALPSVLPMFSKTLIDYTESTFKEEKIEIHTKTMVKEVKDRQIDVEMSNPDGSKTKDSIPYGLIVWATGNTPRKVIRDLMGKLPAQKNSRRGLAVDDYLVVEGTENIYCLGDASATKYAPTAQAASQQGAFLARLFNTMAKTNTLENTIVSLDKAQQAAKTEQEKLLLTEKIKTTGLDLNKLRQMKPFEYSHQGSLAYIGSDKAIADLPFGGGSLATGGALTYYFWRSAYLSNLFSLRNRSLVVADWIKAKIFGRDVSRE